MDRFICGSGNKLLRKNLSRHRRTCTQLGVSTPTVDLVMSAAPSLAAEDDPTCSTSGTPQGVVYGTRRQASTSCDARYSPTAVSTLLKSAISEAVQAILDRHGEYSELELSACVRDAFPAIPQQLRWPVVLAATAAARHAALMHVVHSSNVDSPDQVKRTFAKEAARALSFWALGHRPPRHAQESPAPTKAVQAGTPAVGVGIGTQDVTATVKPPEPTRVSDDEVRRILSTIEFPAPALSETGSDWISETGELTECQGAGLWSGRRYGLEAEPPRVSGQVLVVDDSPLVLQLSDGELDADLCRGQQREAQPPVQPPVSLPLLLPRPLEQQCGELASSARDRQVQRSDPSALLGAGQLHVGLSSAGAQRQRGRSS